MASTIRLPSFDLWLAHCIHVVTYLGSEHSLHFFFLNLPSSWRSQRPPVRVQPFTLDLCPRRALTEAYSTDRGSSAPTSQDCKKIGYFYPNFHKKTSPNSILLISACVPEEANVMPDYCGIRRLRVLNICSYAGWECLSLALSRDITAVEATGVLT